jgi:hypothetical protein
MSYNNSDTHWLAVYIFNDDYVNAQRILGKAEIDHDTALLEVIRSDATIFSNGLRIITNMINGYLIKDTAMVIQACVLHGKVTILSLIIEKSTSINKDWFYYAVNQLTENMYSATKAYNTARWCINYASEHKITLQTEDILDLLRFADKITTNAILDAIYDNSDHYSLFINRLSFVNTCELSANIVKYLYDNNKRKYTSSEYAAVTLRTLVSGLTCID